MERESSHVCPKCGSCLHSHETEPREWCELCEEWFPILGCKRVPDPPAEEITAEECDRNAMVERECDNDRREQDWARAATTIRNRDARIAELESEVAAAKQRANKAEINGHLAWQFTHKAEAERDELLAAHGPAQREFRDRVFAEFHDGKIEREFELEKDRDAAMELAAEAEQRAVKAERTIAELRTMNQGAEGEIKRLTGQLAEVRKQLADLQEPTAEGTCMDPAHFCHACAAYDGCCTKQRLANGLWSCCHGADAANGSVRHPERHDGRPCLFEPNAPEPEPEADACTCGHEHDGCEGCLFDGRGKFFRRRSEWPCNPCTDVNGDECYYTPA